MIYCVGTEQTAGISVSGSPLVAPLNEGLSRCSMFDHYVTMKLTSLCQLLSIQTCIKRFLNFYFRCRSSRTRCHAKPVLVPPRRSDPGYRIRQAHEATSDPRPGHAGGIWSSAPSATNRKCDRNTIKGNISSRGLEAGPKSSLEYALFTLAGRHDRGVCQLPPTTAHPCRSSPRLRRRYGTSALISLFRLQSALK